MPKTCSRAWKDLRRVFKSYGCQNHRYQFAGPLRQSHPAKSLSAVLWSLHPSSRSRSTLWSIAFFPHSNSNLAHERVPDRLVNMVPSNIAFHSNRSHSSRISSASHLHLSACASLWLRPVIAILYTWLTSLRGTNDLYDATLECARGKFFPFWRNIRKYRFGIFNFDAELEWCKFRALTVWPADSTDFCIQGPNKSETSNLKCAMNWSITINGGSPVMCLLH